MRELEERLGVDLTHLSFEEREQFLEAMTEEPMRGVVITALWSIVFWLAIFDLVAWLR